MTVDPKARLRPVSESQLPRSAFDRALSVREVADVLGLSTDSVYRLLREGRIAYQKITPRRTVVRESALNEFLADVTFDRIS
jgi:excisionase family DNA binding protein